MELVVVVYVVVVVLTLHRDGGQTDGCYRF